MNKTWKAVSFLSDGTPYEWEMVDFVFKEATPEQVRKFIDDALDRKTPPNQLLKQTISKGQES